MAKMVVDGTILVNFGAFLRGTKVKFVDDGTMMVLLVDDGTLML